MCAGKMHADEVDTDVSLVGRLLAAQFPQWADHPIEPVHSAGTDNALYRLGDDMAARLQPASNGWNSPTEIGTTTVRVEVFVDDPDTFIEHAIRAGADGTLDSIRDHQTPWGKHRQGGFFDPFGHLWLVGDKSPLNAFRS
jgi:hypothetical protein